ncbi:MAG: SulP family inorganic anion transporter [Pacificimonas sp.]|jgi:SulP family sulfate permease|nr:SulP family inorganic anion transporter [Pacificimonas sp.]
MQSYFPGLSRLKGYGGKDAAADLVAGLILAVLLVPQAMAYARLAGLPPEAGLYTAMAPALIYAFLGTSSYVSIGPVALASILAGEAAANSGLPLLEGAAIIAVQTGILLALLGIFRMGRLVNFVSEPALLGFLAAIAVLIGLSQLGALLGVDAERGGTLMAMLDGLLPVIGNISVTTVLIGLGALALLLLADRFAPPILWKLGVHPPWRTAIAKSLPLLILVLAAIAALALPGVTTIDQPPSGLPPLTFPAFDSAVWLALLPDSAIIAVIIFVTGTAVAKSLAGRNRQALDSSQESIALGAASVAAGMTGGYVPGVSLSRSALVYDSGARTPFASAVAAAIVLLVLLLLSKPLSYLPEAALAALVMAAVSGLVRWGEIVTVARHSKREAVVIAIAFFATLALGIQWGLILGAASGIALYLWSSSLPRITRLGYEEEADHYRSVDRDEVEIDSLPVLVLRIDRSLFFGNVARAEDELLGLIARHEDVRCLLIDMKGVNEIDASGLAMLERLVDNAEDKDLRVGFAVVKKPLLVPLQRSKLLRFSPVYEDVEVGVEEMKKACGDDDARPRRDALLASDRAVNG